MLFEPDELPPSTPPFFSHHDDATVGGDLVWAPVFRHACSFGPDIFASQMMTLIRNPQLNSSWLFRADILCDSDNDDNDDRDNKNTNNCHGCGNHPGDAANQTLRPPLISGFSRYRTIVRRLVPRNERRDRPLEQTCCFYRGPRASLVLYLPHASSAAHLPFYHPKVRGIAHLHEWDPESARGTVSIHLLPFEAPDLLCPRLRRTAYHLLEILHKHAHGSAAGYAKRVHHDILLSRPAFQNTYARLKASYARALVESWAESTDPAKHVFEDLAIAAFLITLWSDMYPPAAFPGFVDIGCGNGLLVHLLLREGYPGWGFDARARKSWTQYQLSSPSAPSGRALQQRLLLPSILPPHDDDSACLQDPALGPDMTHPGTFPPGTFIISNHADELTPWTPILAALSDCPFIVIPCCSHNLAGDKYRPPPPRDKSKPKSTYASFVDWVSAIAQDCGWLVETEMLRIPSTRNTCLLGRKRSASRPLPEPSTLLHKYGGADGYHANVAKLLKSAPRGH